MAAGTEGAFPTTVRDVPFPDSILINVEFRYSARSCLHEAELPYSVGDSWPVFRERIRPVMQHDKLRDTFSFNLDQDLLQIIICPSIRTSFKKFEKLETEDMEAHLKRIWRNIRKNGQESAHWKWRIAILGSKPERVALRTSEAMLRSAVSQVRAQAPHFGSLETQFVAQQIARMPTAERQARIEHVQTETVRSPAHRQVRYLDSIAAGNVRLNAAEEEKSRFFEIECQVKLRIPIVELKKALGLPEFDLVRLYPRTDVHVGDIQISNPNQADVDHQE